MQSPASGPILTPGAAKITEEASYGTTDDMGAVVDELQAWVEEQLHWLKGDTSSLETLSESEETALGDLVPELHNGVFRFRDPEPVCTDEINEAEEAAQGRPSHELLNESFLVNPIHS